MSALNPDLAMAPIVGIREHYEPGMTPEHAHQRIQLMYAITGCITVITQQGSWVLPPNRALFIPSQIPHALQIRKASTLKTLYMSEKVNIAQGMHTPLVVPVSPLVRELISTLVDAPWDYTQDSPPARLAQVLCDYLAFGEQEPVFLPQPQDARGKALAKIFFENPGERRPLAELADAVCTSTRTLERLFQRETGISLGAWVQQLRLLRALELLAGGESVGNAAFQVGFGNPSSFIALFKRQFGVTPKQYFA